MTGATTPPTHPGWRQIRPDALTRELHLRDSDAALALVNRPAQAAEDHLRRPDHRVQPRPVHRGEPAPRGPHAKAEFRLLEKVNAVVDPDPAAEAV